MRRRCGAGFGYSRGLAGSEAAWQVAQHRVKVTLFEMRPQVMPPAHRTGDLAELLCSNSLGSNRIDRATGLLKKELRRLGFLIVACADETAFAAGGALGVDREAFSRAVSGGYRREELKRLLRIVKDTITTKK